MATLTLKVTLPPIDLLEHILLTHNQIIFIVLIAVMEQQHPIIHELSHLPLPSHQPVNPPFPPSSPPTTRADSFNSCNPCPELHWFDVFRGILYVASQTATSVNFWFFLLTLTAHIAFVVFLFKIRARIFRWVAASSERLCTSPVQPNHYVDEPAHRSLSRGRPKRQKSRLRNG